jgi:hypothetical protein
MLLHQLVQLLLSQKLQYLVGGGAVGLKRLLILEDGTVFEGKAFGAEGNVVGEVPLQVGAMDS